MPFIIVSREISAILEFQNFQIYKLLISDK